jgi:hypothetical protein
LPSVSLRRCRCLGNASNRPAFRHLRWRGAGRLTVEIGARTLVPPWTSELLRHRGGDTGQRTCTRRELVLGGGVDLEVAVVILGIFSEDTKDNGGDFQLMSELVSLVSLNTGSFYDVVSGIIGLSRVIDLIQILRLSTWYLVLSGVWASVTTFIVSVMRLRRMSYDETSENIYVVCRVERREAKCNTLSKPKMKVHSGPNL